MSAQTTGTSDAPRHERRIVYLKDDPDTRPENVMCPSVTCPGHCSCASKSN